MESKKISSHFLFLLIITAANLLVLLIRDIIMDNTIYQFLLWNLFLAFVPLAFAGLAYLLVKKVSRLVLYLITFLWLLFYPNAPYMISDMIHVNPSDPRILYDTLILFSFAMLSVFYGFYSIKIIKLIYEKIVGVKTAASLMTAAIILSSFGIYLGRILRLNSWDLFTRPMYVLHEIIDCLLPVTKNPATYAVIFLFSGIQFMLLYIMNDIDDVESRIPQEA